MSGNLYFVPFSDTVIRRYKSWRDLPSHGKLDPRLCHGKIRVTLTARTPVMVAGEGRINERGLDTAIFSRDPRGKFRIPGSSFRGLIRQNMQILGLGAVCTGRGEDIPDGDRNLVHGNRDPKYGIPKAHQKNMMDYPRSMLGFVIQEEMKRDAYPKYRQYGGRPQKPRFKTICYRSRISVGDLMAQGNPKELNTVRIDQRLPRQNHPDFITETGGNSFRLNGFRQYPPRPVAPEPWKARQGFRPLDAGTRFTGVIRYRNLHPDELGLLLWSLRLEEGCLQTIGMGKAEGYGQMTLTIDSLVEYVPENLYSSLTNAGTPVQNTAKRVDELIRTYRSYAAKPEAAGTDPANLPHIKTFLDLRSDRRVR